MWFFWLGKVSRMAGTLTVAALIGSWPTWHWGSQPALVAMVWAAVVALLAGAGSLYIPSLAQYRRVSWLAQAFLAGSAVLILLMLPLGGLVYWLTKPPVRAFWAWITLFYFFLLVWQTRQAVKEIRQYYSGAKS